MSVKVASEIEEPLIEGVRGNCARCEDLIYGEGYEQCESVADTYFLTSEFRHVYTCVKLANITSLETLAKELKTKDMDNLWLVS